MARLTANDRQAQIVELLNSNGSMKITELAERFQVSRETIRRDLNALSETGTIRKGFGGAIIQPDFHVDRVETRLGEHTDAKLRICEKALAMIPDGSVLYLDTGSTPLCLARLLKPREGLTIITNSLPVMNELAESRNRLIMTGGDFSPQLMAVVGMQTIEFLSGIKFGFAFLGSSGYDQHHGPAGNRFEDSQIKKTVIANAQTTVVLCDSSKATRTALTEYASWRDIHYLITDGGIPEKTLAELQKQTTVIVV